jgi:RNA recognition motif-containing protein
MKKKTRFYKTENKKPNISKSISDAPTERKCGYFQVNNEVATIYVGNLKYNKTEKQVQELFGRFGSVKYSKIVLDQKTGKGKGIAFVQMPNKRHAQEAIEGLNGTQIDGRAIKVSIASERDPDKFLIVKAPKKPSQTKRITEVEEEEVIARPTRRKRDKGLKILFNHLNS